MGESTSAWMPNVMLDLTAVNLVGQVHHSSIVHSGALLTPGLPGVGVSELEQTVYPGKGLSQKN